MCKVTLQRNRHVSYIFFGSVCIGEVSRAHRQGFVLELYRVYWRSGWPNRHGGFPCVKIDKLKETVPFVLDALHRLDIVDRKGYYAL